MTRSPDSPVRHLTSGAIVLLAGTILLTGTACRRSNRWRDMRPKTCPVTGLVTLDGKPLEGALVTFAARERRSIAAGLTSGSGRFTLRTYEPGDGAVEGPHAVLIEKTTESFPPPKGPDGPFPPPIVTHHLPAAYRDLEKSGLEATVTVEGRNDFTFELSSK